MSAGRFNGQVVVRNFAFRDQQPLDQQHGGESMVGPSGTGVRAVSSNPRVRDLHARADQMFALGYAASGWRLREQAWRLEGSR